MMNNSGRAAQANHIHQQQHGIHHGQQVVHNQMNRSQNQNNFNNNNVNHHQPGQINNQVNRNHSANPQHHVNNQRQPHQQQSQRAPSQPNANPQRQQGQNMNNNNPNGGPNRPIQNNQQAAARPANAPNAPAAPPPPPPVLPKGWKREEIVRTKGITAGLVDVVYCPGVDETAPNEKPIKYRSKLELHKEIGTKYDMSLLDFKTGKASLSAWRKQRRVKSIAANPNNFINASRYDNYLFMPTRQIAPPALKGTVNLVTNNKNDPTPAHLLNVPGENGAAPNAPKPTEKPKPAQLFWELRFKNLRGIDVKLMDLEPLRRDLEITNLSKFKNFETNESTPYRTVANQWHIYPNKHLIGQNKDFNKNARIFIEADQPLIPAMAVKVEDVQSQEEKLNELRKLLKENLEDLDELLLGETDQELKEQLEQLINDHKEEAQEEDEQMEESKPVVLANDEPLKSEINEPITNQC